MTLRTHPRLLFALVLALLCGCARRAPESKEMAYVAAQQVMLRDRLASVYNKVGTAKNGERLVILDKQKRFVKVRTERGEEGWVEQRYLADSRVFVKAQALAVKNVRAPSQGQATTRNDTNLHIEPGRDADHIFLVKQGDKVAVLARATAEKPGTRLTPKDTNEKPPPPVLEDWRLVRDTEGHAGWVLARMVDLDVPLEVAQYAEGQRIVAYFVLNEVPGKDKKVPQYLLAMSAPKEGLPDDFDQVRVFTWNPKRDHYETAYREHNLAGQLPIRLTSEDFGTAGKLPEFVLRVRDDDGNVVERKYKLDGVMVRRVLAPGEEPPHPAARRRRR